MIGKKDLHMVFIDFEKVYNKIPRKVLWSWSEKKDTPLNYIRVSTDTHFDFRFCMKDQLSNHFLFTSIMDELMKDIHDKIL